MRKHLKWLMAVAAVLSLSTVTALGQAATSTGVVYLRSVVSLAIGSGSALVKFATPSDGVLTVTNAAGTDFTRMQFGGTTSSFPSLKRSGAALTVRLADDSANATLIASSQYATGAAVTSGGGTGISVVDSGLLQRVIYKVTITSPAFVTAAVTSDVTIATLPAKTVLVAVYADLTTTFACTATCTSSTLSFMLGSAAGGSQYLAAALDLDAAITQFGDADAEMGSLLTRAGAIQGGAMSWAGNIVSMRLTSGTGNIGTGAASNLSQGTITFYLITEKLP